VHDSFGYSRLLNDLEAVRDALASLGLMAASEQVSRAIAFYGGGSPTEFIGESRIALATVLREVDLPATVRATVDGVLSQINLAFDRR
jgi:hypothetical protein